MEDVGNEDSTQTKTEAKKKTKAKTKSPKLKALTTSPKKITATTSKQKTTKKQKKTVFSPPSFISPFHLSASSSASAPTHHHAAHIPHTPGSSALIQHAIAGDFTMIKKVLENTSENVNQTQLGCSALHYAAFHNRLRIVEFLIFCKADVNLPNLSSETPLHWSSFSPLSFPHSLF